MPEPAPTPWLRVTVVIGLLTFSGITLASNVAPARDNLKATRHMLATQELENALMRERIDTLRSDAAALREAPWVVGRVLREEFNLTDEGEIRVLPDEDVSRDR